MNMEWLQRRTICFDLTAVCWVRLIGALIGYPQVVTMALEFNVFL